MACNRDIFTFYFITGIIKSMRMRCREHAQHMEELREAYKILLRKPTRSKPLRRPKNRGENSIKMDLTQTRCDNVDWTHLAQWLENRAENLLIR
jgi:hypothetical protein